MTEIFSEILLKFQLKFWRTEKFLVNLGHILKKCKFMKNLENI